MVRVLSPLLACAAVASLSTAADAQQPKRGAAPAAAAVARPAAPAAVPHFAPVAPHFAPAAPHFAPQVSHFAPQISHFAMPHFAPRVVSRVSAPHVAHLVAPHVPHVAHIVPRVVPHVETSSRVARTLHTPTPTVSHEAQKLVTSTTHAPTRAEVRNEERLNRLEQRAQTGHLNAREQKQLNALQQEHTNRQLREQNAQKPNTPENAQKANAEQNAQRLEQQRRNEAQLRNKLGPPVTAQQAQQGRFAAAFANRADRDRGREWAGEAWRHHHRAGFVPWLGPLFWPYAYDDIFYYTFWPYGYDDGFWAYTYDDFFDSLFWPNGGPYADYGYAGPYGGDFAAALPTTDYAGRSVGSNSRVRVARQATQIARQLCGDPGNGVTAWPFAQIERAVTPTPEQQALLDDLKKAAAQAAVEFKTSCSTNFPMTPPGRLRAMLSRLEATRHAVEAVRQPLAAFYDSLNDEQKARFNAIGPNLGTAQANANAAATDQCNAEKPGLVNLPIERIADALQPNEMQQAALERLRDAVTHAVATLQAACPDTTPLTPVARLDAMEKRLDALITAAKTVQPALEGFYASLSDEQKAQFNVLGRQTASGG